MSSRRRATWSAPSNTSDESLALNRELRGGNDPEVAAVLVELSSVFMWNDDMRSAEQAVGEAVNIFSATVDPHHPDRVLAEARLAEVLLVQNRINEAGPIFEKSLESQRVLYGEDSQQVADVLDSLRARAAGARQARGGRGLCPPRSGGQ